MACIAYLERNDFTAVHQLGPRLLKAMDGTRCVYIYISVATPFVRAEKTVAIPNELIDTARECNSRVDVIKVQPGVPKGSFVLKHLYNAVEA
jgi:hypothetical protein